MNPLHTFLARLRAIFNKPALDADFAEELAQHLDAATADGIRAGMTPDEAQRQARIALGGVEQTRELHRDARGLPWLEELVRDVRCALRSLRKAPGFALAATLTLGLGIGACVAVFSAVDTVLLRPLPFPEPDRLVRVAEKTVHARVLPVAYRNFQDLSARSRSFAGLAAISGQDFTLQGIGDAERVFGAKVSADFLSTFGATPAFGRDFTVDDDKDGAAPVAILGPDIWRRLFGADPSVIGRTVVLDGRAYSIVGIAPPGFRLPLAPAGEVFVPAGNGIAGSLDADRGAHL